MERIHQHTYIFIYISSTYGKLSPAESNGNKTSRRVNFHIAKQDNLDEKKDSTNRYSAQSLHVIDKKAREGKRKYIGHIPSVFRKTDRT